VARASQDIANIGTALRMYQLDLGVFPPHLNALRADFGGSTNKWKGPYLERLPKDPWQNEYQYRFPGLHETNGYDLYSLGKDGVPSKDDITNW
jgi:general secretion pathway protein G